MNSNEKNTLNEKTLNEYVAQKLSEFLDMIHVKASEITTNELTKIRGGKHGTYAFSVFVDNDEQKRTLQLILKLYTDAKVAEREYLTLKALESADFPAPHVYILEMNEKVFGAPFIIMEKINGQNMRDYVKTLNNEETYNFFELFAELLVTLHELKVEQMNLSFLEFPKDKYEYSKDQALVKEPKLLSYARKRNLEWAINWLEKNSNRCPCNFFSLLHGDMNPNNFLITETGQIIILDWTWSEIGDALKDVGYVYHNIRHMFGLKNVENRGEPLAEHFLNHYAKKSSQKIEPFTLQFYLFSAGLREAMFMKMQSELLLNPIATVRLFGVKFFPIFLVISWHFRSRFKNLRQFIQEIMASQEKL